MKTTPLIKKASRLPENDGNSKKVKTAAARHNENVRIKIAPLEIKKLSLTIHGTSPLVVHAWSKKAKDEMVGKQRGIASTGKEHKDPVADFRACFYHMPDDKAYGFPAVGLKASAVDAANDVKLQKTAMRRAFHILGDLVPIEAPPITEPLTPDDIEFADQIQEEWKRGASMRSDAVRLPGTTDIRFRPQFPRWKITFNIEYNSRVISPDQLVNLFNAGGGLASGSVSIAPKKAANGVATKLAQHRCSCDRQEAQSDQT